MQGTGLLVTNNLQIYRTFRGKVRKRFSNSPFIFSKPIRKAKKFWNNSAATVFLHPIRSE